MFVFICWTWTLISAKPPTEMKLELFFQDRVHTYWSEEESFNISTTIDAAVRYATSQTNGHMVPNDVNCTFGFTTGYSLSQSQNIDDIISFLRHIRTQANVSTAYSVFVGPSLGSLCPWIADWMPLGLVSEEAQKNLYQIEYTCQNSLPIRYFASLVSISNPVRAGIVSFAVNLQSNTLIRTLNLFLRQQGWKNIAILYELSIWALQYRELAWSLKLYLTTTGVGRAQLNVIKVDSLKLDSDPRRIVGQFDGPCQAIILLGGPKISYYFIEMVSNMSRFENCETAIIQVDPSNAIAYDVLRRWRYILSTKGALGTAAQCTYLMTALPAGQGFDISSDILKTKLQLSLASAVALAIRLTYFNYAANGDVPPTNRRFFTPLKEKPFSVPVLPNVTYYFSNYDDSVEYYDLYFFTFTPAIAVKATNIDELDFEGIFELNSVLLNPNWTVETAFQNFWSTPGRGPAGEDCLLSPCLAGTVVSNASNALEVLARV
ncbi:unnamed protein product [Schistocephalus solidus]|uniref:ANF_receptor domain-containing protein n=1 Tax=Schistocephalus solidus TaxID=70667 RepID=A0A183SU18_SCHSO|nr:unnamed protein product [Schistocephalus solidus]